MRVEKKERKTLAGMAVDEDGEMTSKRDIYSTVD